MFLYNIFAILCCLCTIVGAMVFVIEKMVLGVILAAPLGPVTVEMIKRGLNRGFWAAFNIRLGGAIGNMLCLAASWKGLSYLINRPMILTVLASLGSLLLFYMGVTTLRKKSDLALSAASEKHNSGLVLGFYLAIFNPVGLIFWSSIFAANISKNEGFWLNSCIVVGVLLWGAALSFLLAFGKRILNRSFISIVTKISGLLMIVYSVKYAYNAWL